MLSAFTSRERTHINVSRMVRTDSAINNTLNISGIRWVSTMMLARVDIGVGGSIFIRLRFFSSFLAHRNDSYR